MNEHTGDSQRTRPSTGAYRDGWDRIFSPRNVSPSVETKYVYGKYHFNEDGTFSHYEEYQR